MPYKYLRDPLFIACVLLYVINRFVLKPFIPNAFSQKYLNDLICIPFWVPIMLFFMRKLRFRTDDMPPRLYEILIPLIVWTLVFELFLPYTNLFRGLVFSDHVDVLFYTLGALIGSVFWQIWYQLSHLT